MVTLDPMSVDLVFCKPLDYGVSQGFTGKKGKSKYGISTRNTLFLN